MRRGNAVAALALTRVGGLASSDTRMAKLIADARNARVKWWRDARKKTVAEAVNRSPEAEVWRSAEDRALPPLMKLLERIELGHVDVEQMVEPALQALLQALTRLLQSKAENNKDDEVIKLQAQQQNMNQSAVNCE